MQIGSKGKGNPAQRSTAVGAVGCGNNLVQLLAVGSYHILHICLILETPLYLERSDACRRHLRKMVDAAHITKGKPIAGTVHTLAIGIGEVEPQPTELRALAAVGTAAKTILGGVAHPRVTHAERAVDKSLQLDIRHLAVDVVHLADREFTGKNHPREPYAAQPCHPLRRAVVGLGTGMKRHPPPRFLLALRNHPHKSHVLHEDGIDAHCGKLVDQCANLLQLTVIDDGVDRHIDLGEKAVGIVTQHPDVVERVACRRTGAILRRTDIDGIGSMVDGRHPTRKVAGRCEQFKRCHRISSML